MHNVSIGDIFTDSNEVYRVIAIHHTKESLKNPYLEVAVFVGGSGFVQEDNYAVASYGFTLTEAVESKLKHYKAV